MSQNGLVKDHFRRAYYETELVFIERQGSTLYIADGFVLMPLGETHPVFEEPCFQPLPEDGETKTYSPDKEMAQRRGTGLLASWRKQTAKEAIPLILTPWLYEQHDTIARMFTFSGGLKMFVQKNFLDLLGDKLSLLGNYRFWTPGHHQVIVAEIDNSGPVFMMMPLNWESDEELPQLPLELEADAARQAGVGL